ncbi:hypothetical protein SRHO_G00068390 [Serrasalmus rhombeus]
MEFFLPGGNAFPLPADFLSFSHLLSLCCSFTLMLPPCMEQLEPAVEHLGLSSLSAHSNSCSLTLPF